MIKEDNFLGRDIISIDDFSREEIDFILSRTRDFTNVGNYLSLNKNSLQGKILVNAILEDSTRTSMSFQIAMLRQGGSVVNINENNSSRKKGETLRDTAKIISRYSPDVVTIRHKKDGSAQLLADEINCPVINAGDGKNHHPTQTLLDLYTISRHKDIDGLKIAVVGDLKYGRTVHSLVSALNKYDNCSVLAVSPEQLKLPQEYKKPNLKLYEYPLEDLETVIKSVDFVYMTRIQRERFPEGSDGEQEYQKIKSQYSLRLDMLNKVKPSLMILHPLPKVDEIQTEIDNTGFAGYYEQAENGIYIRACLLNLVCGGKNGE